MKFAVIRDCCTSGNCDKCHGITPLRKCLTVTQTPNGGVDKVLAERYATNWREYNARIVTLEEAERAQSITDQLCAERRAYLNHALYAVS